MLRPQRLVRHRALLLASLSLSPLPAFATDSADLQKIRQEFDSLRTQLRQDYENRIADLEQRLKAAEAAVSVARETPRTLAPETAPAKPASRGNAFNPEIGMVLSGTYANLKRNPENYRITGFVPGGEIGPGARGFSLGESELSLSANVDQLFYGNLTLAVSPENEVSAEEAFIQTTSLPQGGAVLLRDRLCERPARPHLGLRRQPAGVPGHPGRPVCARRYSGHLAGADADLP